jgi:hypothetical protein
MSSRKRAHGGNDFNSLFGAPLNMKTIKEKNSSELKLKKAKKDKEAKNDSNNSKPKKDKKKHNQNKFKKEEKTKVKEEKAKPEVEKVKQEVEKVKPEVKKEPKSEPSLEEPEKHSTNSNEAAEALLSIKTSPNVPKKPAKTEAKSVKIESKITLEVAPKITPEVAPKPTGSENRKNVKLTPKGASPTDFFGSSDSELEGKLESSLDFDSNVHSGNHNNHQQVNLLYLTTGDKYGELGVFCPLDHYFAFIHL